ncbi:MAG: hypothetical protein KKF89_03960 [Nanoarchaeota archaeon]|nr:hypothetical protein [Nanoarchaeota archaeon]
MNFVETLLLILAIALSIIAIRISFKFDINQFLENRRKVKLNQLKNICPHGTMSLDGDKIIFQSYFSSPSGTVQWGCSQCGLVVNSEDEVKRINNHLLKDPKLFITKQKKFSKETKKLKIC